MGSGLSRFSKVRFTLATGLSAAVALTVVGTQAATAGYGPGAADDPLLARGDQDGKVQVVHVLAATAQKRTAVLEMGLDTTEHADATGVDVILHGEEDAAALREAGFKWNVEIPDLEKRVAANAAADVQYAAEVVSSPLPSGSNGYRDLADFNDEMARLASRYPRLVKPLTLKYPSVDGRSIQGIEITQKAAAVNDGKPVFLMMGAHHAREWPSAEHSMEFAYDLLENYRTDDRARRTMNKVRTIIVPVVNVDGYVVSREAAPNGDFSLFDYEMKRKNCSVSAVTPPEYLGGDCADNPAGRLRGTDLNRNYPGFWGGPGASATWSSDTYRGDGPGSEPEVAGVRDLISNRQVTNLITNHTYSNLVLRPPSIAATGLSPDEPLLKSLGNRMTDANGYTNWASYQLYDTSGSVEDWSYWNTGGLGYTFEIGPDEFHPPYADGVVAEYLGLPPADGTGFGGNREAYYRMAESALTRSDHARIVGKTSGDRTLTVSKRFISATSPVIGTDGTVGPPRYYEDNLTSTLDTDGGRFAWSVNPSTRPVVVGRYGREPQGPTEPNIELANPAGIPAEGESEQVTFEITGMPDYDNGTATVVVGWPGAEVDWDVDVLDSRGRPVSQAASLDNPERAVLVDPAPGTYTVQVTNYGGGTAETDWTASVEFAPPTPGVYSGLKESWNLTCADSRGQVLGTREVIVDRGEVTHIGDPCGRMSPSEKLAAN